MKYRYEIVKGKLVGPGGPLQANATKIQNLLFLKMNNQSITDEDLDLSGDIEYEFGGSFIPSEGAYEEHPLYMTSAEVLEKYKDKEQFAKQQFASFFGEEAKQAVNTGYIGKWNPDISKQANIYYILMPDGPHEMFLTYYNDMKFITNVQQVQYVVNINGNMMDCTPEENDVLFDNFEEASKYFKDVYLGELKVQAEIAAKEAQRIEDEKINGKPIESLGDGTYIGQQSAYEFYYQGQKYKSPIGIRCSFPTNVIVDIRNGKVSFRDWGTPYDTWLGKNK